MLANGAKGYLINESIEEEAIIEVLPIDGNHQEEFEIFYSHELSVTFIIDSNEVILMPNELLIIKINNKDRISYFKIKSGKPCNILRARVKI